MRKVGSIELVNDFSLNDPCTRRVSECLIDYVPDLELGILIDMKNRAVKVPESFSGNPLIIRGDPQVAARGRALAEQNHCNICHRSDFTGQENVPRVADQREDYLLKTLRAYKTGTRHAYDGTMAEVLQPVDDTDLGVLAHFLARVQ